MFLRYSSTDWGEWLAGQEWKTLKGLPDMTAVPAAIDSSNDILQVRSIPEYVLFFYL